MYNYIHNFLSIKNYCVHSVVFNYATVPYFLDDYDLNNSHGKFRQIINNSLKQIGYLVIGYNFLRIFWPSSCLLWSIKTCIANN